MNSPTDIPPQLLAQLEDYYDGALPAAEAAQLRSRFRDDPALAAAVAEWESVYRHGLRTPLPPTPTDDATLRERFATLEAEFPRPTAAAAADRPRRRRRRPRWGWLIAATALLVIGLGWWLFRGPSPVQQLAQDSFTWLPRQEATLGPAEDAQVGLRAYDRQEYAMAYPLLLEGVASGQLDSINLVYAGVAALGAHEPATARDALQKVLTTGRYPLAESEIRYYLGLAYLQLEDIGAGTQVLSEAAKGSNPYSQRARVILKDLEGSVGAPATSDL